MERDTEDFHFKGILPGTVVRMKQLISPYSHQVISLQLISRVGESAQMFFFDMGEGISTDIQHQDILYVVAEGQMQIRADQKSYRLQAGDCMLVPESSPHSIEALTALWMFQISAGEMTAENKGEDGFEMNEKDYIKNIDKACVHTLSELVGYQENKVASLTLVQRDLFTTTLMAMDKGTGVGPHVCEGDALVVALEGEGDVMIGEEYHQVKKGECIVMPANLPHAVRGKNDRFKMMLIVSKPELPHKAE